MVEAIAGRLMDNLQELALNEAKALVQVKHDILRLRDRLVWLQAFLLEADPIRRVDGNLLTGVLVSQTRAVALDSEDAIDRYLVLSDTIASRRGWRRVIIIPKLLERFAQQFIVRHYLSVEVTMLNTRIEDILDSRDKYKLDDLRTGSEADDAKKSTAEPRPSWALPTGHGSFSVTRRKRNPIQKTTREPAYRTDAIQGQSRTHVFIRTRANFQDRRREGSKVSATERALSP